MPGVADVSASKPPIVRAALTLAILRRAQGTRSPHAQLRDHGRAGPGGTPEPFAFGCLARTWPVPLPVGSSVEMFRCLRTGVAVGIPYLCVSASVPTREE